MSATQTREAATIAVLRTFCNQHAIEISPPDWERIQDAFLRHRAYHCSVESTEIRELAVLSQPDIVGDTIRLYDKDREVHLAKSAELNMRIHQATNWHWLSDTQRVVWLGVRALAKWFSNHYKEPLPQERQAELVAFWLEGCPDGRMPVVESRPGTFIHRLNNDDQVVCTSLKGGMTRQLNREIQDATERRWIHEGKVISTSPLSDHRRRMNAFS